MTELDPIRFKDDLGATLARYITTAAAVSSARAPRLSRAVADACARSALVRGPFVESLPDFEKGGSIEELVAMGHCTVPGQRSPKAKKGDPFGVGGFTCTSQQPSVATKTIWSPRVPARARRSRFSSH